VLGQGLAFVAEVSASVATAGWMALMGGPMVVPMVVPLLPRTRVLGVVGASWGSRVVVPVVEVKLSLVGIGYRGLGWAETDFLVLACSVVAGCLVGSC